MKDPNQPGKAQRSLASALKEYRRAEGLKVRIVEGPGPHGAYGEFLPHSREILLFDCGKHKMSQGALMEELLHYQQYKGKGLLGMTTSQIERRYPGLIQQFEIEVEQLLRDSGFIPPWKLR